VDLKRPAPATLRAIKSVRCTINDALAPAVRGNFCDGLIVAANALFRRTAGKKYRRRIVVITDAEHEVDVDGEQLQCVVDGLKSLEVQLIVIGIGFQQMPSAPPDNGALGNGDDSEEDLRPDAVVSGMHADCDGNRVMIKEEGNPDDMADEGVKREAITGELVKQENEKLLRSVARLTKGCVLPANGENLVELLQTKLPCLAGMKKSMRRKAKLHIAPGLMVEARLSKLTDCTTIPSVRREARQLDPVSGNALRDGNGELMTTQTRKMTFHYDGEEVVSLNKRTDAFWYGADLVPVAKMEIFGLEAAFASTESIEVIGYLDRHSVLTSHFLIGNYNIFNEIDSLNVDAFHLLLLFEHETIRRNGADSDDSSQ